MRTEDAESSGESGSASAASSGAEAPSGSPQPTPPGREAIANIPHVDLAALHLAHERSPREIAEAEVRRGEWRARTSRLSLAVIGLLPLLAVAGLSRALPGAEPLLDWAGPLMIGSLAVWAVVALRRRSALLEFAGEFPRLSDTGARVRVVGHGPQLRELAADLRRGGGAFEAETVRLVGIAGRYGRTALLLAIVLAMLTAAHAGPWGVSWSAATPILWMMAIYTVPLAQALLWPTYLRLVPGRIDLIEYGPLGLGRPRVRSIDVRAASVSVDLDRRFARIVPPGDGSRPEFIAGPLDPRSSSARDLVHAVARAAASTRPTPELVDDELGG